MNREEQIFEIARTYSTKYTCGCMADWQREIDEETNAANDWLFKQINELHITKDELKTAIDKCEELAKERGSTFMVDPKLFSTKFFRN